MSDVAVTNSTCLISLERIERLEILRASFESVLIPPEVREEFGSEPSWIIVRPVMNMHLVQALRFRLDRGEAAAIALAVEVPHAVVVLDDRKARITAQGLHLPIIGTIGLLLRAKRLGLLTEVHLVIDAKTKSEKEGTKREPKEPKGDGFIFLPPLSGVGGADLGKVRMSRQNKSVPFSSTVRAGAS